ncbi:hypothetical protein ABPG72_013128 [Tetrahymena utriculariae]
MIYKYKTIAWCQNENKIQFNIPFLIQYIFNIIYSLYTYHKNIFFSYSKILNCRHTFNQKLFKQILITIQNSSIEMEKSQNDLQAIYHMVSKRYLQLKRQSKNIKQQNLNSLNKQDEHSQNSNNCLRYKIDSKSKSCFNNKKQQVSQQETKNYSDEYKRCYIGREKAFYMKYKNDLNAIKFLKHCLFSQINQLDFSSCVSKNNKSLKKKDLRIKMIEIYSYISKKQIMVFLILGLVMFGYNLWNQYHEIILEKKTLDSFRLRYENESEALYQILKQKHTLYEKIKRHKDFGIIQSLLNRQIKLTLSFIFGVLFLLMSLIKALFCHFFDYKIRPMPLFQGLNEELQKQYLNQNKLSQNKDKPKRVDPQQISQLFQEDKMKKEQKFMDIFNQQKEYILKRKQEELIKKEILEQKKNQLLSQLNYLNQQKQENLEKKRQKQRNTLSMCSFQHSQKDNDENQEQLSFISQYYKYDQIHQSEDEDYDLPQFGQKKPIHQLNKFPKRSKLTIQPINKQQVSNPIHFRSKSIGSSFQIINTKNESESYRYCERLF